MTRNRWYFDAVKNAMNLLQRLMEWMASTKSKKQKEGDNGDVSMNGDCKMKVEDEGDGDRVSVPDDHGVDFYASNSSVLSIVNVLKESTGPAITKAIFKEVVPLRLFGGGVDPVRCRLSFEMSPGNGLFRCQIMNQRWKLGSKKGAD